MTDSTRGGRRQGECRTGRVWIVGAAGQLGRALQDSRRAPAELRPLTSGDIDIRAAASVAAALDELAAGDVVINCAAYTDVDAAEAAPADAAAVNADGPAQLAVATARSGAWLIQISTDYVYAGPSAIDAYTGAQLAGQDEPSPRSPYLPADANSATQPATVYGRTKLAGDQAALAADPMSTIVRTSWVYTGGADSPDFVGTMRRLEQSRDQISVVDDQTGSPTYVRDLADGLWELVEAGPGAQRGGMVLHASNAGTATWCDLARAVFAGVGADAERVQPCTTADFPRPAPRPAYSVLSATPWLAAGLTPLRDWQTAVTAALSTSE